MAVVNSSSQISYNMYDEYGKPQSGNTGRFQYTGQMWITEVELYYYKARIYDARLGRFLQTDPIGYEAQQNLYAYVHNDPVNMVLLKPLMGVWVVTVSDQIHPRRETHNLLCLSIHLCIW